MLTTQGLWRDAMLFEAESGGGAASESASDPSAGGGAMPPVDLVAELEKTKAALATANREAQQRRLKLEAIERAEQERKDQELTEAQKAAARAEKAEADHKALQERHRKALIRSEIKVQAAKAGFVDPEDAVLNLANDATIDIDENDNVIGVDAAIKSLAKAKPHLLASTKPTPPNINAQNGGNPPPLTVDAVIEQKRQSGMYQRF